MGLNCLGNIIKLTTFGESHGKAIGGVIDGLPAKMEVDFDLINAEIERRKGGKYFFETQRKEKEAVEFISGICNGLTLGTPVAFIVRNVDTASKDYENLANIYRPSHADFSWQMKYGIRDYRGGGRASARETLTWVIAGAFAKMVLKNYKINITAFVSQIGEVSLGKTYAEFNLSKIISSPLYCPDKIAEKEMLALLKKIAKEGDSVGGIITCVVKNCPVGLGEPVFGKLQAQLAAAMLSINAVKGFEYGSGFKASAMKGSKHNDEFINKNGRIGTATNNSGGIQGGISNGEDIYFSVAFKPVASITKNQDTVDIKGKSAHIAIKGRHDVCPVPRAVPVVEALTALVIADNVMMSGIYRQI
ncbi:MAG: Chorismate synthase [Bacteroidetes bacterium ADurb.Bin408]|nr:MAG: Chorismate synthase [Bacteroidetes bacterium ADurb.Bin408]